MANQIIIRIPEQRLLLEGHATATRSFLVSTARNGPGEVEGSECTPRGEHRIAEKIGADTPLDTVFVARRPTGEIWSPDLALAHPGRDWILTRILWLAGAEPGRNLGGVCDTQRRYIYIHGSPASATMGVPGSRGCVRMHGQDIIELFERVSVGDRVVIEAE